MQITPYLSLEGRGEEAIKFYQKVLGAKVEMLMRFKDNPEPQPGMTPPGSENKILHAHLKIGDQSLMLSDGRCGGKAVFQGINLSLTVKTDKDAEAKFKALSDGGHIGMPMASTFFASRFGILADKFGVHWMVLTGAPAKQPAAARPAMKAKK